MDSDYDFESDSEVVSECDFNPWVRHRSLEWLQIEKRQDSEEDERKCRTIARVRKDVEKQYKPSPGCPKQGYLKCVQVMNDCQPFELGDDILMLIQKFVIDFSAGPSKWKAMRAIRLAPMFVQRFTYMGHTRMDTIEDQLTVQYQSDKYDIASTQEGVWEDCFDDLHLALNEKYSMVFEAYFHSHYVTFECGHFKLLMSIRHYIDNHKKPYSYVATVHTLKMDSSGLMGYDTWILDPYSVLFTMKLYRWKFRD